MTARPDDDALTWDGDDDPTLDARTPAAVTEPTLPAGFTAVGKDADTVGRETVEVAADEPGTTGPPAAAAPMGNATLITVGIVGGVFLLYTIGWIIGGLRLEGTAQFLVSPAAYLFGLWLAVAAPAVWFATVFLLTRSSAAWVRIVWLLAGVALLVPWPFIMTGAVGQ